MSDGDFVRVPQLFGKITLAVGPDAVHVFGEDRTAVLVLCAIDSRALGAALVLAAREAELAAEAEVERRDPSPERGH